MCCRRFVGMGGRPEPMPGAARQLDALRPGGGVYPGCQEWIQVARTGWQWFPSGAEFESWGKFQRRGRAAHSCLGVALRGSGALEEFHEASETSRRETLVWQVTPSARRLNPRGEFGQVRV
mmetsp:Transcript_94335/g.115524  ORF Transcript_94335/g.115524 Transcript_94335/m.115524 type:complete len:121 (+) Transcript_94335:290-652(+)